MADYVVRMTGQDNLSGTIKQVKSELNDLGKTTSKLDQIDAKFSKITNSTAPLKKQLRDLKALMAQMNMDGLGNTEQYTRMAQAAGQIKDAMDDAAAATKRFSSDTVALDMGVQSLQAITAGAQVATGAMNLFGVENENVQKAMLQVQNLLMIGNGLQQLHTLLINKDSLAQQLLSASTKKATVAQVSQNTATKAGTLAQLKLNAAVLANPYVLAAAAVAALAAGIIYWTSTMSDAAKEEERLHQLTEKVNEATNSGKEAYAKTSVEMELLKDKVNNFNGTKEEEKKLVQELNEKYGKSLGQYESLADWKGALADVSLYYCKVMNSEAKAAALAAAAWDEYKKAITHEDGGVDHMKNYKALLEEAKQAQQELLEDQKLLSIAISNHRGKIKSPGSGSGSSGRSTRSPKTGGGGSTRGSGSGSTQQEETGVLAQLNEKLKAKQKELDDENTSLAQQYQLLKEIADLQTRITRIQNARTAATDGTLADALKPQPLKLTPEIDQKAITDASQNLADKLPTAYDIMQEKQKKTEERNNAIADSFNSLKSVMSSMGEIADDKTLNAAGTIAQAIATYIMGWSEATAQAASLGPWGWAAFSLATAAQLAAIVAQIHSLSGYASGGIISGGSSYGDQILARVNAGEMILSRRQQANLFRAIESGDIGAGQTVLVPEFKIKGSDLYGTLRNFSKSVGKTGKVTGIR